jgi:hypothetical protein
VSDESWAAHTASDQNLWVPKTPSASCGEGVIVDEAADAVESADSDGVEVADGRGYRLEGCRLLEGSVRAVGVVVGLVLTKDSQ